MHACYPRSVPVPFTATLGSGTISACIVSKSLPRILEASSDRVSFGPVSPGRVCIASPDCGEATQVHSEVPTTPSSSGPSTQPRPYPRRLTRLRSNAVLRLVLLEASRASPDYLFSPLALVLSACVRSMTSTRVIALGRVSFKLQGWQPCMHAYRQPAEKRILKRSHSGGARQALCEANRTSFHGYELMNPFAPLALGCTGTCRT
ncbi:hypothetical protein N656DRAFT_385227 [Canariomyces notabilis]|uniref:Uncharacterized protein n=1 Tax=Canariomyces notabilis TaxID=2074819 RepID=A0AAN6YVG7_9PEZI|nr:hypothetical protein N656DRAFT_385227 [Canariomyces arenarius]